VLEARGVVAPVLGSRIVAVAVPNGAGHALLVECGKRGLIDALRQSLADDIDAIALPRRWRFVDALPSDAQGKVTEARLLELFRPMRPEPRWLQRDSASATLELDVAANLAMFDGHFPLTPVLPGVALLDWAISLGREAFAPPPCLLRTEVLKFQALVRPGTRLNLEMTWRGETATLNFTFTSAFGSHASGRLLFGPARVAA